ncbi:phosphotransferase [Caballeronia sp. LZ001]|uniref:phosphotransferase n=1 Tax=Caballeronia sp. LZ001 TaxID=3038553 RepID=UPI0028672DAB|nr:phosphotransferase [Caballeronia sp. LZ001]MDR5799852.1 phosphotransferase [Caballeronia sp. LZ001]
MNTTARERNPAEVAARAAAAAIASIDAWRGVDVRHEPAFAPVMSPMHRGVSHSAWRVRVDDSATFFMKVAHGDLTESIDTGASFLAARAAASLGIAPAAHYVSEAHGATVFDFLDDGWRTAHLDDLAQPATLDALLQAKRAIHSLPAFARTTNVFERIEHLAEGMPLTPDQVSWVDLAGDLRAAIDAAGADVRPCHADGVTSNVMLHDDGALMLVDFDEAANTDPAFDLAVTLNEVLGFGHDWMQAIEMSMGAASERMLARCRAYAFADDLRWGLWGMRMDRDSPRRNVEFLKYAQWRLLRCSMALPRWNLDAAPASI